MYLNRRVKLLVSVMLSSHFFSQLNITTTFLQDTFFRHFEVFTKNNIVMPGNLPLYRQEGENVIHR